jgi:hypothetical protein
VLAGLIGLFHGALFHLLLGTQLRQLPRAVAFGMVGSLLGGWLGTVIPPAVWAVGDTNLIATTAVAWSLLGLARLFRFC